MGCRALRSKVIIGDAASLLLFVEQTGQCLGRCQSPGGFQGAAQRRLSDSFQAHVGAASASPRARTWIENAWLSFDEHFLLDGCEFEHAPIFVGITKRGEELSGDAKVRMGHVRLLRRFREAKGKTAKVIGGHLVASADTEFYTNKRMNRSRMGPTCFLTLVRRRRRGRRLRRVPGD